MTTQTPTTDEHMGMTWWNNLTIAEREEVMKQTELRLGHPVSAAEAWAEWKTGNVRTSADPFHTFSRKRSAK